MFQKNKNFSKTIISIMIFISMVVLMFSMYEMHRQMNLDALPVLIGATITEVMGIGIFYLKKSTVENSKGGITYDMAMKAYENNIEAKG